MKLMTHTVIGYPSLEESRRIIDSLSRSGADFLELQLPFSDPLADGPVIMKANETALRNGATLASSLEVVKQAANNQVLVFVMSYFNLAFTYGIKRFCIALKRAGVAGIIIPDFPYDEEKQDHFREICRDIDLQYVSVVSANSDMQRINRILKQYKPDLIYCTAYQGVTGSSTSGIADNLRNFLVKLKKQADVPVAVGFGIKNKEQLKSLEGLADIAVVGSALITSFDRKGLKGMTKFLRALDVS